MRVKGIFLCSAAAIVVAAQAGQIDVPVGDQGKAASQPVQATVEPPKEVVTKTDVKSVPFKVKYEISRTVGKGRMVTKTIGKNGKIETIYAIRTENGKTVKELVEVKKTAPVDHLILIGSSGYAPSRGSFTRGKVMTMEATAYDPSAGLGARATFTCRNGMRARYGMVAVDPRVIKLGTLLYIEGYGVGLAADTGGAIKGNRIDLCMSTNAECIRFGRRNVRVHILK